jgi:hypothetical protein
MPATPPARRQRLPHARNASRTPVRPAEDQPAAAERTWPRPRLGGSSAAGQRAKPAKQRTAAAEPTQGQRTNAAMKPTRERTGNRRTNASPSETGAAFGRRPGFSAAGRGFRPQAGLPLSPRSRAALAFGGAGQGSKIAKRRDGGTPLRRATERKTMARSGRRDQAATDPQDPADEPNKSTKDHRATAPPRHRATAPPRHRATAPPRHRATAPPRHRATAPPRHRKSISSGEAVETSTCDEDLQTNGSARDARLAMGQALVRTLTHHPDCHQAVTRASPAIPIA